MYRPCMYLFPACVNIFEFFTVINITKPCIYYSALYICRTIIIAFQWHLSILDTLGTKRVRNRELSVLIAASVHDCNLWDSTSCPP